MAFNLLFLKTIFVVQYIDLNWEETKQNKY